MNNPINWRAAVGGWVKCRGGWGVGSKDKIRQRNVITCLGIYEGSISGTIRVKLQAKGERGERGDAILIQ